MKNVGNNSRGRSQGVPKIFRAPMYRAHCAVIFAIAQLSCKTTRLQKQECEEERSRTVVSEFQTAGPETTKERDLLPE